MFTFDHIAVACRDLEEGSAWVAETLGVTLSGIGHHAHMGTHNRLLSLGGEDYLEVIAIDPAAPPPGRPRWFALDDFEGRPRITNWILRCPDLAAAVDQTPAMGEILDLERGPYRWRMAVPVDGRLPLDGAHPALIEWRGPHPAPALAPSGIGLSRLTIRHPQASALTALSIDDPRIVFEEGPRDITARFDTPNGPRTLA